MAFLFVKVRALMEYLHDGTYAKWKTSDINGLAPKKGHKSIIILIKTL